MAVMGALGWRYVPGMDDQIRRGVIALPVVPDDVVEDPDGPEASKPKGKRERPRERPSTQPTTIVRLQRTRPQLARERSRTSTPAPAPPPVTVERAERVPPTTESVPKPPTRPRPSAQVTTPVADAGVTVTLPPVVDQVIAPVLDTLPPVAAEVQVPTTPVTPPVTTDVTVTPTDGASVEVGVGGDPLIQAST